ncbi:helix-turn-helix domain-containing protein [Paenibacillus senegalensis]|uniref:helix-turn-helix domain-containing protein n=1 Tax=Paenibacillus senegalensis TaxID=1465766 RepID=UPI00028944A0|nr:helix-turn-helix domain-containing protein [Paenibacillus senegalensis]
MSVYFQKVLALPTRIRQLWSARRWSNRFYHYLFSYVFLVIVLLLGVSGAVYGSFLNILQKEVENSTLATLTQIKEAMDMRTNEMDRMALQISTNPLLTPYALSENGYGIYQAVRELKKHRSTNSFIYDIMLYYRENDPALLYASSGTYEAAPYFSRVYGMEAEGPGTVQFVQHMGSTDSSGLRVVGHIKGHDTLVGPLITYLYPMSGSPDGYGTILFQFREQDLNQMIHRVLKDYSGAIYILNEEGQQVTEVLNQVSHETSLQIIQMLRDQPRNPAPLETVDIEGAQYSIVQLTSDTNGWTYVSAMPTNQFMSKVNETRQIFHYTILAVFLIGLMIAFALAIRNYRPIVKLTGSLRKSGLNEVLPNRTDEIAFIAEAIGVVTKENEGLLEKLKSQAGIVKEKYVTALIDGTIRSRSELDTLLPAEEISLKEPHYAVLLLLIDDYEQFKRKNPHSMQDLVRYSLGKAVEKLSLEIGAGYAVNYRNGRGIVALLNIREGCQQPYRLNDIAQQAKEFCNKTYRLPVTVGVGGIYDDFDKLHVSYTEADYAARYRLVKGENQVIVYQEVNQAKESLLWYPLEAQKQLVRSIKQGSAEEAARIIREMIAETSNQSLSIERVEFICFDMINTAMKTLVEMDIPLKEDEWSVETLFVHELETLEALEQRMVSFCEQVCQYVNEHKESRNKDLLQELTVYVEDCYADSSINLDQIAARFGFSASYLTRFFKNQTGQSLMRYIDEVRMEKARALLIDTDWTLGEIIEQIGYTDSTNFIRKFKKLEGITPIQYRNLVRGGSQSVSK